MSKTKTAKYDTVIYHKGCPDGFASAYIASKVLGKDIKCIPMSYTDRCPKIKDRRILICDFSFDEKDTQNLIKNNKDVFIIDHHKTSVSKLEKISKKRKLFDMNHSAAYLTWKYFFPKKSVPSFIRLIEDYDIWKFEFDNTQSFMLALKLIPYTFDRWKKLENIKYVGDMIKKGDFIKIYQDDQMNRDSARFRIEKELINGKSYNIAYKNSSTCVNEIGNKLVNDTKCDFSVVYYYNDHKDETKFSLRSTDEKADVSEIANYLNGGGHRNASGLTRKGFHNSIVG